MNKYIKNSNNNKIKIIKNSSYDSKEKKLNLNLRNNSIHNGFNIQSNNSSYILDSKIQDEIINKYMMNGNSIIQSKKIFNRHKSMEKDMIQMEKEME